MGNQVKTTRSFLAVLAAGVITGVFITAAGTAAYHASGNPAFCTACHSMKDVGDNWKQSLHKQYACIECHLPDDNLMVQVSYKTKAGLNDLYHERETACAAIFPPYRTPSWLHRAPHA